MFNIIIPTIDSFILWVFIFVICRHSYHWPFHYYFYGGLNENVIIIFIILYLKSILWYDLWLYVIHLIIHYYLLFFIYCHVLLLPSFVIIYWNECGMPECIIEWPHSSRRALVMTSDADSHPAVVHFHHFGFTMCRSWVVLCCEGVKWSRVTY